MDAFSEHLRPFIPDWSAFYEALGKRRARAFRVTASRSIPYLDEIRELCAFEHCPGIPHTYMITDGCDALPDSISFQTGGIYIMNPASVLPAQTLAQFMPDSPLILDMAAAPGGKTAALSDLVCRKGLITANEPSPARLKALHFNLEKCGAWNVKTLQQDGTLLPRYYADTFDGVLLDAPCSHENQILHNKKISARWSMEYVSEMANLQKRLILAAFDCLRPGGALVYSTCTFSPEENEFIVKHLLDNRENAEIINLNSPYSEGVSGHEKIDGAVIRIFPHLTPYDGFFVAALRKAGGAAPFRHHKAAGIRGAKYSDYDAFVSEHFTDFPEGAVLNTVGKTVYLESPVPLKGNFRRTGMQFARAYGRAAELSSQAAWEFGAHIRPAMKNEIGYKVAKEYLKGFDTPRTSEYDGRVFYYGLIPVGMVKIVDNTYKNKLDRYFLYGKNIEW